LYLHLKNTPTDNPPTALFAGDMPRGYDEDPNLGVWVSTQRRVFKNGKLDQERKGMLDEIGFDFNPMDKEKEKRWNLQFMKLQDYVGKYGHCELMWAVDRFTFISNTPTNTSISLSLNCRLCASRIQGRLETFQLGQQAAYVLK
jgi:hypothetical protein